MNRKRMIRLVILGVSAALVLYGAVNLAIYLGDLVSSRRTAQELREAANDNSQFTIHNSELSNDDPVELTPTATMPPVSADEGTTEIAEVTAEPTGETAEQAGRMDETDEPEESELLPAVAYPNGYNLVSRIQQLRKKSEYIIGWLTMDQLDEPVAFKDNDFFLNHDAMGKKNGNGSIFLDESTKLMTRPYTLMLYGHNMKTGAMFGNLRKYETYAYCSKHRYIQFDTLYEEGRYEIFAVETISLTPGRKGYVNLTALQSDDRSLRREALKQLTDHSMHPVLLDVNEEDQILLLITCVGDDDERLVVAARRLREKKAAAKSGAPGYYTGGKRGE